MAQSETQLQVSPQHFRERISLAGVLTLTLLTFASTFTFGWVYDDPPQIPGNNDLRWDRLGFLFTHHLWAPTPIAAAARFYRPFLALWFLINKTLFGLNPHWFHVTTVMAHVLATALTFFIARRCLKDSGGALLAAAIFGLHPLQVESTSWISSVNDSLAAVFCFSSFLAFKRARSMQQSASLWWILAAAFFFFALLVKEVSAVLPAVVLVDLFLDSDLVAKQGSTIRTGAAVVALYGVPGIAWLLWRRHVLGHLVTAHSFIGWGTVLRTAPRILLFQLRHVILPAGLSPHYDFRLTDSSNLYLSQSLLPLGALLALILLAVLVGRKARYLWVAYAWLLLPLLPSLNPRWLNEGDFVHDRYMYMSMLGVSLMAGGAFVALKRRWSKNRVIPAFCVVLATSLAFASAVQSQYWANDLALFSRAVQIAPNNEWSHLDYGAPLASRGRYGEAASHFVRSYELKPGWYAADEAGFAYRDSGDLSQADRWFQLALQSNASLADAWLGLGQVRLAQHRPTEAIPLFQKALALHPDADGYHYALGSALEQADQQSAALQEYRAELLLHPYQTAARKAIERLSSTRDSK